MYLRRPGYLDLAQLIVCLVVQMELPSYKAVLCRQLALRRTLDSEKQPSRGATERKSRHNSTIKPSLRYRFQCLIFSRHGERALEIFLWKHTQTHNDNCMPRGSGHRGITMLHLAMYNTILVHESEGLLDLETRTPLL